MIRKVNIHKEWKDSFGNLISNKTIFDCEK